MIIEIDKKSGFCFGVQKAISKAEELLSAGEDLQCLGDIVHNREEVIRLTALGMKTISKEESGTTKNKTILLRSHGEPPSTYSNLKENQNTIIDATCPVVLKLQSRIKKSFIELLKVNGQLVIFGKQSHPEVIGLNGQTENRAIVVNSLSGLEQIDFDRPVELYCQTTMPLDDFHVIANEIEKRTNGKAIIHDTICRQVSNRVPRLEEFSAKHDIILFVSGKNSSNGKLLYGVCKKKNENSHFISSPNEVQKSWFGNVNSVGICGATSTPQWLMEKVKNRINEMV